jgi:hypothetical protein
MHLFQIQSLAIKFFLLPSNDLNFSDGNQNPFLVTIHMVNKSFWSLTIGQLKPFFGHLRTLFSTVAN